jgi:hypothetical protein
MDRSTCDIANEFPLGISATRVVGYDRIGDQSQAPNRYHLYQRRDESTAIIFSIFLIRFLVKHEDTQRGWTARLGSAHPPQV